MNRPNSQQSMHSECNSCVSEETAATLKFAIEDNRGECYEILQSYNCNLYSSTLLTCSINNANADVGKRPNDSRNGATLKSLVDVGAYALQGHRDWRIKVQIRDDALSVQMSVIVHEVNFGDVSSKTGRRGCDYSLFMTMMRVNSLLSHESCGGRICAFGGQFVFFQDLPISILDDVGRMQRMLDDFIVKTVEIRRLFDRTSRQKRSGLRQGRDV